MKFSDEKPESLWSYATSFDLILLVSGTVCVYCSTVYYFFSFLISTVKQQNCNIKVVLYLWTNVRGSLLLAYFRSISVFVLYVVCCMSVCCILNFALP